MMLNICFAIRLSSLVKCLLRSFAHYLLPLGCLLSYYWIVKVVYTFCIQVFYQIHDFQVFPLHLWLCLFVLLTMSFENQKISIFRKSTNLLICIIFSLLGHVFSFFVFVCLGVFCLFGDTVLLFLPRLECSGINLSRLQPPPPRLNRFSWKRLLAINASPQLFYSLSHASYCRPEWEL